MYSLPIQYARTVDGVRIAYAAFGDGPPLLYPTRLVGWRQQLEFPNTGPWFDRLAGSHTVIPFDVRGYGLSDRDVTGVSLDTLLADFEAVVEAAQLDSFHLFAADPHFGTAAIAFAAMHARELGRMVLWMPSARPPRPGESPDLDYLDRLRTTVLEMQPEEQEAFIRRQWRSFGVPEEWTSNALAKGTDHLLRVYVAYWDDLMRGPDVREKLPLIAAPTLILHRPRVAAFPETLVQEVAAGIPDARLVLVDGDVQQPWQGDADGVADAVETFLAEGGEFHTTGRLSRSGLQTILFTDLESSTALTQRVGDEGAQEVLRGHNATVRKALGAHGGREVKHTGDGIMASFGSAVAAVAAALQIQRELAGGEVRVRIGLNAGEPIAEDGDLFGTAVQLAARLTARAEPGQVLVSRVVADLCAGKRFKFSSLGEASLKGFDQPVTLFEVLE